MSSPAVQLRSRVSSLGERAVERARLTVVPVTRTPTPRVPFVVLVSAVALIGMIGLLLFNTSLQQASFAEAKLTDKAAALADREETLRMELDELRDPQRIATRAQRMGMVIPAAPAFLRLDGTVVGEPRPAESGDGIRIMPRPKALPSDLRPTFTVVEVPARKTAAAKKNRSARDR